MDYDALYERIKDEQVLEVMSSLELSLSSLPPDGKNNHKRDGLRQGFSSEAELHKFGFSPKEETFSQYRQRDEPHCNWLVGKILETIEMFQITV